MACSRLLISIGQSKKSPECACVHLFLISLPSTFPFPFPIYIPLPHPLFLSLPFPLPFPLPFFPFPSPFPSFSPSFFPSTIPSLSPFPCPSPFHIPFPSLCLPFLFSFPFPFLFRVHVCASNIWGAISPQRCKIDAYGQYGPPIGSRAPGVEWSRDRWRHVTPKSQTRDPIIFETPYLHNGARYAWWRWAIYSKALVTNRMVSWLTMFFVWLK